MSHRPRGSRSESFRTGRPIFGTVPDPKLGSLAPGAIEWLREVAGVELLPWQELVFTEWLEADPSGALTRKSCGLVVPRRNGKTQLLVARMLVGMYLLGEKRVTYTAQDHNTAGEVFEWLGETIEGSEELRAQLKGIRLANGQQRIELHDGTRFTPATRTKSGGRGRETDLLVFDEAMLLEPEHVAALSPLVARAQAQGRGQIIATSSAGTLESGVLLGIRDRGRALTGSPGGAVAYHEYAAPDDADPSSPEAWAAANPSLGTAILDSSFIASQLALLGPTEEFRREHLGAWGIATELPAIDLDRWLELAASEPPERDPGCGVWFAFDLDFARTAARLLLLDRDTSGRVIVHVLEAWDRPHGLDELEFADRVSQLADEYGPEVIGYDPQTGEAVSRVLAANGHRVERLPLPRYAAACSILRQAVLDGRIIHDGTPQLAEDIARAIAKPTGDGGFVLSRLRSTTGPIAGAIALAVGHYLASSPDIGDSTFRVA